MSITKIRAAFVAQLKTLTIIPTQYENVAFTPISGVPYQSFYFMPAPPENPTLGDRHYRERGLCQITLMYPSNTGTADAFYRAEAIQTAFERGVTLIKDGVKVCIQKTPTIERSFTSGDRFVVPISIYYIAEINL